MHDGGEHLIAADSARHVGNRGSEGDRLPSSRFGSHDEAAARSLRAPDGNDYSVHPAVIGRRVQVCADLDRVQGMCDDKTVADHERIWATHQTISDPAHGEAAILLGRARIGALRPSAQSDVEVRARTGYDAALGVDLHGGVA